MKNVSVFQIAVMAIFLFVAIVGVAIFAGFGGSNNSSTPAATIWGILPASYVSDMVRDINLATTKIDVSYVQKDPATFEAELINALAEGRGPDIALLDDTMLFTQKNKIQPIPYAIYNERDYQDTFIPASSIFLDASGVLAVPLSVDPLVMYWNKNMFAEAGISKAPSTWSEFQSEVPRIVKKTDSSSIVKAFAPFGAFSNVTNAKQIISTFLFQLNNPITQINPNTGATFSVLDQSSDKNMSSRPIEIALSFYTAFANPASDSYSWNLSMPASRDSFLANNLATYFGFASELPLIQDKNPNLNLDVAEIPQDPDTVPAVYGKITGLAIMKSTRNYASAIAVIATMTNKESIANWSKLSGLPSVRRDVLAEQQAGSYLTIFNRAAIKAKAWYDPNEEQSDAVFKDMIESVLTGRKPQTVAISDAVGIMNRLFGNK